MSSSRPYCCNTKSAVPLVLHLLKMPPSASAEAQVRVSQIDHFLGTFTTFFEAVNDLHPWSEVLTIWPHVSGSEAYSPHSYIYTTCILPTSVFLFLSHPLFFLDT